MRIVIFIILLSLNLVHSAYAGDGNPQAKDSGRDLMGLQAGRVFYESCKAALDKNLNEDAFKKTSCFAHITGLLQGGYIYAMKGYALDKDECRNKAYGEIETQQKRLMCLPPKVRIKEIATEYIKYMDKFLESEPNKYPPLGTALMNIYKCDGE